MASDKGRILAVFIIAACVATCQVHVIEKCHPDHHEGPDGCYRVLKVRLSWGEAERRCSSHGGAHLVSIHSQEEFDFVKGLAPTSASACDTSSGSASGTFWIGLNAKDDPKYADPYGWVFSDRTTSERYLNWSPGTPDGVGNNPHCAFINPAQSGWKNAEDCSHTRCAVCKMRKQVSSECDPHWFEGVNKCYKMMSTEDTWGNARNNICPNGAPGGQLASITNEADFNLGESIVSRHLNCKTTNGNEDGRYWIGLHDKDDERGTDRAGWQFADGTPYSDTDFHKWLPGEPNGNSDCVQTTDVAAERGWGQPTACSNKRCSLCSVPKKSAGQANNPLKKAEYRAHPAQDKKSTATVHSTINQVRSAARCSTHCTKETTCTGYNYNKGAQLCQLFADTTLPTMAADTGTRFYRNIAYGMPP